MGQIACILSDARLCCEKVVYNVQRPFLMPRHAPILGLVVEPRLREIRGERRLLAMAELTGVPAPILSQLERGERYPRFADLEGLQRGYGSKETWYRVTLETREEAL